MRTPDGNNTLGREVVVPLKQLSDFWISLGLPLFNCEMEVDLSLSEDYILSQINRTPAVPANPNETLANPRIRATSSSEAKFQINNAKLYVPVVTLSIDNNIFFKKIKPRFKRRIFWNKYRSEITTQPRNNDLDYMIDPTFKNINRLFVLSFKNGFNDPTRDSFDKYFMPLVEVKDFNAF